MPTKDDITVDNQAFKTSSGDKMEALRHIILQPEQEKITQLQRRLDNKESFAEEISQVLPSAVESSHHRDQALSSAMMPIVESAVKVSIRNDISTLVDAFYPMMGPAIRKAIAEALKDLVQSLNVAVENSLSWQGLQWRIESMRTGRSFSEIALLRSLVFRVEQVLLIHRETGCLLQHLEADSEGMQDMDMVSGMLSAISDFVQDSFSTMEKSGLHSIRFGDLTIMIEPGPLALIAVAIRGNAPQSIRDNLQQTLELIHIDRNQALSHFKGDIQDFAEDKPYLRACLQTQYKEPRAQTKKNAFISPRIAILLLIILLLLGYWGFSSYQTQSQWQHYINNLRREPGFVITEVSKNSGRFAIKGLRDPLAKTPQALREATNPIPEEAIDFDLKPYQALSPQFILLRAELMLNKPEKVTFNFNNGILRAKGIASYQWQKEARQLARFIPGIEAYDDSEISINDLSKLNAPPEVTLTFNAGVLSAKGRAPNQWIIDTRHKVSADLGIDRFDDSALINIELTQLHARAKQLEQKIILFQGRSAKQVIQQLEEQGISESFEALAQLARMLAKHITVNVIGHTDLSGSYNYNVTLSQKRANLVHQYLVNKNMPNIVFQQHGVASNMPIGKDPSGVDKELNRSVTFTIKITRLAP